MKTLILPVLFSLTINPCAQGEERTGDWNQDVLRLFELEQRDDALQKLLKEGRYPDKPAYKEKEAGKVKEVVICPQADDRPLVTVFAGSVTDSDDTSTRSGHFMVIRNDGVILPFYHGANSLDGYLYDLNGDGTMDFIDSWGVGYVGGTIEGLHVVPITENFKATLNIYWKSGTFDWRLFQPNPKINPTVQIGKKSESDFMTVAEYTWSKVEERWIGSKGSIQEKFLRVDGEPRDMLKELLEPIGLDKNGDKIPRAKVAKAEGEE